MPYASFADTDDIQSIVTSETVQTDKTGQLALIYTTTSYFVDVFNIEVEAVQAVIKVNVSNKSYEHIKLLIKKDQTEYIYNLVKDVEYFPLQMGSGAYDVTILGSNDGRRFRLLGEETFKVELKENAVFLSASQTVNWDHESEVALVANELTQDAKDDNEKLEILHTYVIENVRYDYAKANALPKGYIPSPIGTMAEGKGICYDFAALLASMLRSVDVPTKLIKGYSSYTPVYHAWNEVLVDKEWLVVDTSTDSIYYDYEVAYTISKAIEDYVMSKEY